ncbi:MAG TPA: lysylphosphatidylglycerol synthase transmembrane domain-containing protein [Candidatus Limnocylindrales bacterium]|nr:lysylphosphatidylglycerol synthase transmembrane domain-containing protein [Candidatus Limnocylindrales bacterium]
MPRSSILRVAVGVAISAVLLGITLARVDLGRTAAAIGDAAPLGLLAAVAIVLVDLNLRALRWLVLLRRADPTTAPPPYRLALGYLTIGFAANAVLPARLGDVARAMLAGAAFGMPRLAMLGTILVERLADGFTMLALALGSSLLVTATVPELRQLASFGLVAAIVGAVVLVVAWFALTKLAKGGSALIDRVAGIVARVAAGAGALRSARGAASVVLLTVAVASTATIVSWTVARSVGVSLGPVEAVLFLSGVALSLAIPAAPGSLGTYEFVGVTILTSLGYSAEQALATMVLMRVVTTFPPAICGVISLLVLQVRPSALVAREG